MVQEVADYLGLTLRYLNEVFKRNEDVTIYQNMGVKYPSRKDIPTVPFLIFRLSWDLLPKVILGQYLKSLSA